MISILYVDDESALLDIAKRYLEKTGSLTVETAVSAQEALEKIDRTPYDAIISDYQMPGMNGIEFLQLLRASGNSMPFIIFTGKGREEVVIQAFDSGADFYIQKGGEPRAQFAELAHKVTQAVEFRRSEKSRAESEQKLQDIINFLPDATFAIDISGSVIAWNRAIEEMTRVPASDMLGKGNYEYALPFYQERRPILIDLALQDHDEVIGRYSFVRQEGGRLVAETTDARLQGKEVVLWGMASSLYDSKGQLAGAIESIRDITVNRRAQEDLRKTRDLLKLSQQAANAGSWDWDIPAGILTWSEEFFALFGLPPTADPSFETWLAVLHPDDREPALAKIDRSIQEQSQLYNEYRIILPDGTIRLIGALGNTAYDENGKPVRMSGICIDITGRRQAEEALAIAEEKYAKAFIAAPDAITISEFGSGRFIEVNDAASAIFGYSKDEMLGKNAQELGIWRNTSDRQALIDQINKFGHVSRYEVIEHRKSGELFLASVNADTMTVAGTRYLIAIIRDISGQKQAEEAVRESEGRYHNIIEDQTEFICRFLPDGTHVFVNGAYASYFGKAREELIGHIFRADIFPEDRDKVRQFFASLCPEHPVDFIVHRIVMPDGEVRWQRWSDRAIFDKDGTIVEYQSVGRDITESKRIESALRESQIRYQNIVEDQTEFVCRFLPDGTHVFVNGAYARYFGKRREDLIGNVFLPETFPEDREKLRKFFKTLTPGHPVDNIEHRIIMPDGEVRWQRWSDRAIFDENGKVTEYQSVGRDITGQKQIEAALRDSEQLRMEIINHLPDPTFAINVEGTIIAWNKAIEEFLGIEARNMIGKGNYEYAIPFYGERRPILIDLAIHPDEAVLRETYDAISRVGETLVAETTVARPLGRTAALWAKVSPLYDKSGSLIGAIETIRDITERKSEETKLRHVNRQLNLLSGITRHDILNQLLVLKGYLDLSQDVLDSPEKVSAFLKKGEDAALTIEELILFTKEYHDLGVKPPEWQDFTRCIAHAKSTLHLRGITVETENAPPEVYADPLFGRVFYNLIDNALRYGGDRMTTIRFSSHESDAGLTILCEDNGEGVPAGKKKAIFNREYFKHTGFGLYLSREILQITGISIIENGEPGKGARFEITVPKGGYRFTGK
jgi:PAS domain S-box-containing protein